MEIADAVQRALEVASPLLEQRRHHVDVELPSEGLGVEADGERLAQVVSNLLTNAAKYSNVGSCITITGRRNGDKIRLSVKDEGIGIPADMLETIFELFVQQPQTIERSRGGLGLGLAIVRNLIRMHGGTVVARSAGAGKGSEFVIELPAVDMAETRAAPALPVTLRQQPPNNRKRILMVDDNEDVATTLKQALEQMGHVVAVAEDGPSALKTAKQFHPEVALLDIGLPAMDGYELAQRLRAMDDISPHLRLIAVTGYGLDRDRVRSAAAGFDAHIVKPVDIQKLVQICCQ
jgi:CheY-like chemotaxis protein